MNLVECTRMALSSLYAHKLRSLLTMLGIVIGVSSIIAIVAIGKGGEAVLKSKFSGSGNNTVEILYRMKNIDDGLEQISLETQSYFSSSDISELLKVPDISRVITSNSSTASIYYYKQKVNSQLIGISDGYYDVNPIEIIEGRAITSKEIEQGRKVALISEDLGAKINKERHVVGEFIEMEGTSFKIIGVYKDAKKGLFNIDFKKVMVPLTIWPSLYGTDDIQSLIIQSTNVNNLRQVGEHAVDLLNMKYKRLNSNDGEYYILNLEQIQQSISTITNIMTGIIAGIAAISLIVGGIGVMNIMLVSVTERTREIGIRKALGATRKNILTQFLIESITLTTLGGSLGILIGVAGAYSVALFSKFPPLISWQVIVGGVLFSMFIGILFGMIPANKASKSEPIESLRYE
ncbi:ABC transporter permease [Paenibacillus marchantiophytorum]|uniref:ABC transporter permease n=1 Tax=Paenibacillus marchantiophytorum TaxID=1619310 RepID=A0ABQ1FA18_9BACL|nr:ABC transporter permease [Paenibacillus marchantiophytorum]GGA03499.1 ABC transporter permease [Paenibacillus marchantiophytorum]